MPCWRPTRSPQSAALPEEADDCHLAHFHRVGAHSAPAGFWAPSACSIDAHQ